MSRLFLRKVVFVMGALPQVACWLYVDNWKRGLYPPTWVLPSSITVGHLFSWTSALLSERLNEEVGSLLA